MDKQPLKIVTFNVRQPWDYPEDGVNSFIHRAGMILTKIDNEKPDVLCFQEVKPEEKYFFEKYLVDYVVYAQGRNADLGGEGLAIACRKGAVEMLSGECFWLSPTPEVAGSRFPFQSLCPRICMVAKVKRVNDARPLMLYNIHLDNESEKARIAQMKCLFERIEKDRKALNLPFLIMGDFNSYPNGETIAYCNNFAGVPVKELTDGIAYTFHDFGRRNPPVKIDYIYADSDTAKLAHSARLWEDCRNGIYLSDHYPVCLTLDF